MSYGVKKDSSAWRTVSCPQDCGDDETFETQTPKIIEPAALDILRMERDRRLKASDVLVFSDRWECCGEAMRLSLSHYRQALRDIPQTTIDPFNPVWPEVPQ